MISDKKLLIAEMLLAKNIITKEQLEIALSAQKKSHLKIGQVLIEQGIINEEQLLNFLSEQLNIDLIDLSAYPIKPELIKVLPEFYARHFKSIVLEEDSTSYLLGMVDPIDILAQEEIERILKKEIRIALIREQGLTNLIDTVYRRSEQISHFAESLSAEMTTAISSDKDSLDNTQNLSSEDIPVVNLLRSILEDASQMNASDIHIEPSADVLRIRIRVDGVLHEQILEVTSVSLALVQRIKLMAGLNIAEKRLPQDGRFSISLNAKQYDVRVSTIPIVHGESVVMRLLNQSAHLLELAQIGLPKTIHEELTHILTAAFGILLIVGPTGSGKTTTLYAALNQLNRPEDKIITVEDPVEYRLPRINQVQVNTKIGLTFASVLRSILRQDPDIIMIGELRDQETIEISMRAAMTGHFVLATLHTNDTISSVTRLIDMGAQGYVIGSVLRAVIAQRLIRKICLNCVQATELSDYEKNWLQSNSYSALATKSFKHGAGCTQCNRTGYLGRTGIFELLVLNDALNQALRNNDSEEFTRIAKATPFYKSLTDFALELAEKGITTISEVIKMAGEI